MQIRNKAKIIRITAAALFIVCSLFAFSGFGTAAAYMMHFEFAPAVLSWISGASIAAVAIVMGHILLARCAGRFYCSLFCVLGIAQDISGALPFARNKEQRDGKLRFFLTGIAGGTMLCGCAVIFFWLDPYSLFGRGVSNFFSGASLPFILIIAVTIFKRRFFCNHLCPVGNVLGLMSRSSVWRLQINESCVNCGKCVKVCPAGCIRPAEKLLDNERCLRCMECVSACPAGAVKFIRTSGRVKTARREFLKRTAYAVSGAAAGIFLVRSGVWKYLFSAGEKSSGIYPPGAAGAEHFSRRCTGCLLCTKVCPQKIIVPHANGAGPVHLELDGKSCLYNCTKCGEICPTGAIRKLPLSVKRQLRIAKTVFSAESCIVYQEGAKCGKCASACPTGAVFLKRGAPRFREKLCIGCGACAAVCPTDAYSVSAISEQQTLEQCNNNDKVKS